MTFLHELKRRRVVRVAIVYAATAFVVLQAADLLGSGLALPAWVFAAITVVTVLGFPLALVLAWAFQITREDTARENAATERWLSGRTIGVTAVALLLVIVGGWFLNPVVTDRITRAALHAGPSGPFVVSLVPPPGQTWAVGGSAFAVAPDGRSIAIVAQSAGGPDQLVLRGLDGSGDRTLSGTSSATSPFWSPDSRSLGFFARGELRVLDLESGSVRSLCPAPAHGGATWGARDVILYAPRIDGLYRTSARGGPCERIVLRGAGQEARGRPTFLGDGRHYVLSTDDDTWLGRVDDDSLTYLRRNTLAVSVAAAPDYLLFRTSADPARTMAAINWTLEAQRIDVRGRRLVGEPIRLLDGIRNPGGRTAVSTSANGVLAAQTAGTGGLVAQGTTGGTGSLLVRVERSGAVRDSLVIDYNAWTTRYSRDGRRIAHGGWGLWLHDVERGINTRVAATPDTAPQTFFGPVWSPGDTLIAFTQRYQRSAIALFDTRTGEIRELHAQHDQRRAAATDWSSDGRMLAFVLTRGASAPYSEAWVYDFETQQTRRLFDEAANVGEVVFSPDGRWFAYESDAGGDQQVYVRPLAGGATVVRVSGEGGRLPRWRADGTELYYAAPSGALMAVRVRSGEQLTLSSPAPILSVAPFGPSLYDMLDVSPDGQHFLFRLTTDRAAGITLIIDWWKLLDTQRRPGGM
jgi:eukaryotic-like serine/threonine-protein kinase